MFYCEGCRSKNNLPESLGKSRGECELCSQIAVCNDVVRRTDTVNQAFRAYFINSLGSMVDYTRNEASLSAGVRKIAFESIAAHLSQALETYRETTAD